MDRCGTEVNTTARRPSAPPASCYSLRTVVTAGWLVGCWVEFLSLHVYLKLFLIVNWGLDMRPDFFFCKCKFICSCQTSRWRKRCPGYQRRTLWACVATTFTREKSEENTLVRQKIGSGVKCATNPSFCGLKCFFWVDRIPKLVKKCSSYFFIRVEAAVINLSAF